MDLSPVLVDSSYYIDMLRRGRDPLRTLALTAAIRDLATCAIVRCEVGRGLRVPTVLERFRAFWDAMAYVQTDQGLWRTVEDTLWQLDRQEISLPLTDVVVGCCALRIGAVVLTSDKHFGLIPGVHVIEHPEA